MWWCETALMQLLFSFYESSCRNHCWARFTVERGREVERCSDLRVRSDQPWQGPRVLSVWVLDDVAWRGKKEKKSPGLACSLCTPEERKVHMRFGHLNVAPAGFPPSRVPGVLLEKKGLSWLRVSCSGPPGEALHHHKQIGVWVTERARWGACVWLWGSAILPPPQQSAAATGSAPWQPR